MVYDVEFVDDVETSVEVLPRRQYPVTFGGRTIAIAPSPTTVKVAKATLGAAVVAGQGWHSWQVRMWDALTLGVYRRQIRAAEASGDKEALGEWVDREEKAKQQRHARMMDLPILVVGVVKTAGIGCAGVLVLLLVLSTMVWAFGVGEFGAIFSFIGGVIHAVLSFMAVTWPFFMFGIPALVVFAAWREGKRRANPPGWLVATVEDMEGRDVIPDEGAILNALRHLGIPELNKVFKEGWRPRFVLPTTRDAKGYHTQLELPPAVTVEMINKKKKVLAHNLVRFPVEVWPTEPRNLPGVLDMWVADQGALSGPVDPWPLLKGGTVDYFKGVPVGINIRGTTINGRLSEANYALAGMMGSGKSTLIITLLLGAMLDPLVDIDVFVMAVNADYDPMKPRLRTLLTGTGEDVVEACLATLRGAYDELDVRGKALKEHNARAVTRELAEKDARLRPRIIVIDECQALFMHPELGDVAVETVVKLISAARKYGITLMFATPEASSDSLPRKVMAVTSNKACFAIGDQQSNDAILGTGSYKAGISAVGLEPKTDESNGDVGTCMARGFTAKPGLMRCYYVSQGDAGVVVKRAMELRSKAGITAAAQRGPEPERDLLDDLDQVLGDDRIKLSDIPSLLRKLAPTYRPYSALTGLELRDILVQQHAVRVTNTGNVLRLDPADLRSVRARRETSE
jgi:S-DNA-T family DNA segregation ATPase FtsK/SpoIIIE